MHFKTKESGITCLIFLIFSAQVTANECSQEEICQTEMEKHVNLENEFIEVIQLIESQTSQITGIKGVDAVFFLGLTGAGKSTIFNWLMGSELKAVKNKDKKTSTWVIESESDGTNDSKIGHNLHSQTSIPTIGKSRSGQLMVDFPGWEDTRGWQYDLVNQFLAATTTENCSRVKIVFVCDQKLFETNRGNGIKSVVEQINQFAQGKSIGQSAMLIITKVKFDDDEIDFDEEKENFLQDIRKEIQQIIQHSSELNIQSKTIVTSMLLNDIYIMEKASKNKQKYTDEERNQLMTMIENLQSIPLVLKPNLKNSINVQFSKYFTFEISRRRERVKFLIKEMRNIFKDITKNTQISPDKLLQMNDGVELFKTNLIQNPLNQVIKYESMENLYVSMNNLAERESFNVPEAYDNLKTIANYFQPIKQHIVGYEMEIFKDEDFEEIFQVENLLSEHLKNLMLLTEQEIERKKLENEKLIQENREHQERFKEQQAEEKIKKNRMLRHIANQSRGFWFWQKDEIPSWVEDVEEYIRMGG